MTNDTQELLKVFARLFRQPTFTQAVMFSQRLTASPAAQRGPLPVLQLLATKQPLTNAEIVEALDIRPSSVSALVAKLEERGLIARQPDPDDGRVMQITLTAAGQALIEKRRAQHDAISEDILGGLSDSEQATLNQLLNKLLDQLQTTYPDDDRLPFPPRFQDDMLRWDGRRMGPHHRHHHGEADWRPRAHDEQ